MVETLIFSFIGIMLGAGALAYKFWPILSDDSETTLSENKSQAPAVPREAALFTKKNSFTESLKNILSGSSDAFEKVLPELEETLLLADVGIQATERLVEKLRAENKKADRSEVISNLKSEMVEILTAKNNFEICHEHKPHVIYFVGVNGVGKTTTIGKLAAQFKAKNLKVLLVAADTFRAAAADQLKIWADRNGVECIAGAPNADPSSVIVDGLRAGKSRNVDVILVDTAGRLQTKSNLMDELRKMARMCEKVLERPADDIFLVVDAITGQNGFSQAKIFCEAVPVSGVILTKYDSTSKGGIILSIATETKLPIRYLGMGEKIEDLKLFEPKEFVENIFG